MIKDYSNPPNFSIIKIFLDLKKKPAVKELNQETIFRARDEELKNQDKMTKNLYIEYEKLQKRMEQVGDPLYVQELRRKNDELDNRIKVLTREQKAL